MKWWQTAWQLVKDVLLTGTGLVLIIIEARSPHPSTEVLLAGLTLTVPSAASHVVALLSAPSTDGHGERESSPSSGSRGAAASPPSASPPQQGGTGE